MDETDIKSKIIMNWDKISAQLRLRIIQMSHEAKTAHLASALSCVDILTVLYESILNVDSKNPYFKNRDRFILSKGHAALALYCILFEKGIIRKNILNTFGHNGTKLMAHVSHKVKGVEFSTGSLGHGLPVAVGKALYFKINNKKLSICILTIRHFVFNIQN
mgnify:CR=1 FL=1